MSNAALKEVLNHREPDSLLTNQLENGKVIYCPNLSFDILEQEQGIFTPTLLDGSHKNMSTHPHADWLGGAKGLDPTWQQLLKQLMQRFYEHTHEWVNLFFPDYHDHLEVGRTSFRPAEILGRQSSKRKDDTRLHVDAFPSTPLQGKRILRVFSNINPAGQSRVWHIGENFEQVKNRFDRKIPFYFPIMSAGMHYLGLTKSKRSAYDQRMLNLHHRMKLDEAYQQSVPKTSVEFPAGSSWFVYTDVVSHAALQGQYVLEQTYYLPYQCMNDPLLSPYALLSRSHLHF